MSLKVSEHSSASVPPGCVTCEPGIRIGAPDQTVENPYKGPVYTLPFKSQPALHERWKELVPDRAEVFNKCDPTLGPDIGYPHQAQYIRVANRY